eukprot:8096473-Alexandrium_andersonii.AAC.1
MYTRTRDTPPNTHSNLHTRHHRIAHLGTRALLPRRPWALGTSAPAVDHPGALSPFSEELARLQERPRGDVIRRRVE